MNKIFIGITFALMFPLTASADSGACTGDHEQYRARKIEQLDKELSLTNDQKSKLDGLFQLNEDKFKAIRVETEFQLKTILTPEQYSKLQKQKQRRQEQWREKHHEKQEKSGTARQ